MCVCINADVHKTYVYGVSKMAIVESNVINFLTQNNGNRCHILVYDTFENEKLGKIVIRPF